MKAPTKDLSERGSQLRELCAGPLFDFWLDERTPEADFQAIGHAASEGGFSFADVHAIYWHEVVPAILGTWGPMDMVRPEWLEQRLRQRPGLGYWLTWLLRPWWGWVAWRTWRDIARWLPRR